MSELQDMIVCGAEGCGMWARPQIMTVGDAPVVLGDPERSRVMFYLCQNDHATYPDGRVETIAG